MADDQDTTEPSFWESGRVIGNDLKAPVPSTQVAGQLGAKYGDVKTASVGGAGDAISAVTKRYSPPKKPSYISVYQERQKK